MINRFFYTYYIRHQEQALVNRFKIKSHFIETLNFSRTVHAKSTTYKFQGEMERLASQAKTGERTSRKKACNGVALLSNTVPRVPGPFYYLSALEPLPLSPL